MASNAKALIAYHYPVAGLMLGIALGKLITLVWEIGEANEPGVFAILAGVGWIAGDWASRRIHQVALWFVFFPAWILGALIVVAGVAVLFGFGPDK